MEADSDAQGEEPNNALLSDKQEEEEDQEESSCSRRCTENLECRSPSPVSNLSEGGGGSDGLDTNNAILRV